MRRTFGNRPVRVETRRNRQRGFCPSEAPCKWVESRWEGVESSWLRRNTPKVWARVQPLPVRAEMGLESTNKGGYTFLRRLLCCPPLLLSPSRQVRGV